MRESQIVLGWVNEGKIKGAVEKGRAYVLEVLRLRFQDPVPEAIRLAVEGTNDPDTLDRWFHVALTATSLAKFRAAMKKKA
jgi:hypothetical protein